MRQFVSATPPSSDGRLVVQGKDFRYLRQVLRLQCGQVVNVRLPSGELKKMVVEQILGSKLMLCNTNQSFSAGKDAETGVKAETIENSCFFSANIWLFQFLPKPQTMDLIVRQATETGVSVIVPVESSRSQQNGSANRKSRWERIIREARQQSGSPEATKIMSPVPLSQALDIWEQNKGQNPCAILLTEENKEYKSMHSVIGKANASLSSLSAVALAVGCEGGIAPNEMEQLKDAAFRAVHFETNILRVDTAALYGLAVLRTLLTEQKTWQLKELTC